MWDLPGPGLEPVSPALAGGFLTTVPPGKPIMGFLKSILTTVFHYHLFSLQFYVFYFRHLKTCSEEESIGFARLSKRSEAQKQAKSPKTSPFVLLYPESSS